MKIMTDEQIIALAKEHLEVLVADDDEMEFPTDFAATKEQLIEFAQRIADIEYDRGFDGGWENRADAERAKDRDTLIVSQPTKPAPIEQSINRVKR
jgi:hypothetical protein